jgi:hypothetical protein
MTQNQRFSDKLLWGIAIFVLIFQACKEPSPIGASKASGDVMDTLRKVKDLQITFVYGNETIGKLEFDMNGTKMCVYGRGGAECYIESAASNADGANFELKKEICVNGEADECQKRTAQFYVCSIPASELKKITPASLLEAEIQCKKK